MTAAVEARGATVAFDGVTVLDDIDLRIAAGEFVALLGSNGAGKTTLVKALLGLVPLAAGSVRLDGEPPERDRDGAVALVPQRLPALGAVPMSVGEVVAAGRVGRRPRWPRAADRAAVSRALADVGLSERRRSRLDHLSGGQQRRVLIARALAGGARTLFLDEPPAGVDAESQRRLADLLRRLSSAGATIIREGTAGQGLVLARSNTTVTIYAQRIGSTAGITTGGITNVASYVARLFQ